jgi:hypothetical protein
MIDIFAQFATDESAENNGAWHPIGGDSELLVARSGNKAYAKLLTALVAEHRPILDLKTDVADAKSDEIMSDVLAKTILLGWKNLSYKGQAISYTVDNAKKLLKHGDFRGLVIRLAEDADAYRAKMEVEQGNG